VAGEGEAAPRAGRAGDLLDAAADDLDGVGRAGERVGDRGAVAGRDGGDQAVVQLGDEDRCSGDRAAVQRGQADEGGGVGGGGGADREVCSWHECSRRRAIMSNDELRAVP